MQRHLSAHMAICLIKTANSRVCNNLLESIENKNVFAHSFKRYVWAAFDIDDRNILVEHRYVWAAFDIDDRNILVEHRYVWAAFDIDDRNILVEHRYVWAAFDIDDRSILVEHPHFRFGIADKLLAWFKSYFTDNTISQRLLFFAIKAPSSFGVSRGSVLGNLFHRVHTNPCRNNFDCYLHPSVCTVFVFSRLWQHTPSRALLT